MLCVLRYTGATNVSNLFVYAPDGCVIWANLNNSGSFHDSTLAQPLVSAIDEGDLRVPQGYYVVADSAFSAQHRWIRKSLRRDAQHPTVEEARHSASVTSARQGAEWGNASLTRVMSRLRVPMRTDKDARRRLLLVCVQLHNLRCRRLHASQIDTVYSAEYEGPLFPRLKKSAFYEGFIM